MFHPIDDFAVFLFLHGDMSHRGCRRSSVPVFLSRRKPDHVTRSNFLNRTFPALSPAAAGGDDQRLTERMRMPGRARAGLERPVLARLRRAMALVRVRTLPQGLLGQAIDYALKRREALTQFVEDGALEIDNNSRSRVAIRPSAIGKKNWLFIRHPEAGERSAVIYTLLGSCRRHGLNPFEYLKDLFTRLPAAKITEIKQFTPRAWARANAQETLIAQAA